MDINIAELIVVSLQNFLQIYMLILFIRILLTWFPTMEWAQQGMAVLSPVTDPYLNIFQSFIPPIGGINISWLVALLALQLLGPIVIALLGQALLSFA
ncbi:MAG: YggT family protein [Cyanobacteria bacterium P01_G01_bin.54]